MNKTIIIGNLCHDPGTKAVGNNNVCNFTVAINGKRNNEQTTQYVNVGAWGKTGENCQKYLKKGDKVLVEGEASARAYTANDGSAKANLQLFAHNVEFLSKKDTTANDDDEFSEF